MCRHRPVAATPRRPSPVAAGDHGDVGPQGHHIPPAVVEADQEAAAQVARECLWRRGSRRAGRPRVRCRVARVRRVPTAGWRRRCGRGHGPVTAAARRPAAAPASSAPAPRPSPRSWTLPREVSSRPPSPSRAAAAPSALGLAPGRAGRRAHGPWRGSRRRPRGVAPLPGRRRPDLGRRAPSVLRRGSTWRGAYPRFPAAQGGQPPCVPLLCCARSPIRTPAAESGKPEEAGVTPARSRHCDRGPTAAGARNSCRSHPARGEDPEEESLRCCSCCRPLTPT